MTFDEKSFEIQRWHSTTYAESWITNREQEEGRKSLRRKLVASLPFESEASFRVLDLGAGGGALSEEILVHFPNVQIVCQDFSEVMLSHAKQHLAKITDQAIFICNDLSTPDWSKSIPGMFDAVVSSLVMHTVPGRVSEIYHEVFGILRNEGCFVIGDSVSPPGPTMGKVYLKIRLKNIQAAIKAETGIEENLEDIEHKMQERRRSHNSEEPKRVRNPLRAMLTLENHLEWLKAAGFDEIDCPWKEMQRAIIIGIKH